MNDYEVSLLKAEHKKEIKIMLWFSVWVFVTTSLYFLGW